MAEFTHLFGRAAGMNQLTSSYYGSGSTPASNYPYGFQVALGDLYNNATIRVHHGDVSQGNIPVTVEFLMVPAYNLSAGITFPPGWVLKKDVITGSETTDFAISGLFDSTLPPGYSAHSVNLKLATPAASGYPKLTITTTRS